MMMLSRQATLIMLHCLVFVCVCVFCLLAVLVRLPVPVQVIDRKRVVSETSCRRAAATICPRPSLPPIGAETPGAAEQTAT